MRVVMTGGGTGGHLFPGVAVADELKRRDADNEIMFIGTEKGIEARIVPKLGYPIRYLRASGVLGRSPIQKMIALFQILRSVATAVNMYRARRPDVVVGTGGYVSVAPVVAAWMQAIPTLVMEQNMVPGMATRYLAKIADQVAVTYHETMNVLPREKCHLTGNPVRQEILGGRRVSGAELFQLDPMKLTVLVFGGSSGSKSINEATLGALNQLLDLRERVQFLHQSGESDFERVRKMYRDMGFTAMAAPFIDQMAEAYALADVVVSRAGATTLAELTALGKPAVLVPYPHAAGHQHYNARKLLEAGGCRLVRDEDLDGDVLAMHLRQLCQSEEIRGEMRRQSRALGRPDAVQRVADLVQALARSSQSSMSTRKNNGYEARGERNKTRPGKVEKSHV